MHQIRVVSKRNYPYLIGHKNPGAVDKVLNLGEFWRLEGTETNRDAIVNLNKDKEPHRL